MNTLWIEDFNQKDFGITDSENYFLEQYHISRSDVTFRHSFSEALEYISNNPTNFDLVLLDIDLFGRRSIEPPMELYQQYFSSFLHEDYFRNNVVTVPGVFLFLYLVNVHHFPLSRIAFVSAYIQQSADGEGKNVTEGYLLLQQTFRQIGLRVPREFSKFELGPAPSFSSPDLMDFDALFQEPAVTQNTDFIQFQEEVTRDYIQFRRCAIGCAKLLVERLDHSTSPHNNKFFAYALTAMPKTSDYTWEHFVIVLKRMINSPISPTNPPKEDDREIIVEYLRDWDIFSICEGLPPVAMFGYATGDDFHYLCSQNSLWKELFYYRNNNPYTMSQFVALSCCKHFRNWVTHTKIMETKSDVKLYTFMLLMSFRAYYATDKLEKEQQDLFHYSFMSGLGDLPPLPERHVIEERLKQRVFEYNQNVAKDSDVIRHLGNARNRKNPSLQHYMDALVPISHLQYLVAMTSTNLVLEDVLDLYLSLYTRVTVPKTKTHAPLHEVSYDEVSVTIPPDYFPVEGTLDYGLFSFAYSYLYG